MNKIAKSLAMIALVAAVMIGATGSYFSDTEKSAVNTFTAGTLEISISDDNSEWTNGFTLNDMKPCFTDYINFKVINDGNNPVDITKTLTITSNEENGINDPECEAYGGTLETGNCIATGSTPLNVKNNLQNVINYDLSVEVYDCDEHGANCVSIWSQTIYVDTETEHQTIKQVYGNSGNRSVYLGMIPVGGHMLVTQSYHMDKGTGNAYQSDKLGFDITIEGKQITGKVVLENKTLDPDWKLILNDGIEGTLTYDVKGPKFKFDFDGEVDATSGVYVLAAGMLETPTGYDVDTYLGEGTVQGDGTITFSGDIELGKSMEDVKVWLMPKATWNNGSITWANMDKFLWETGLIWYVDTDL